jgi:hypothetical protein
MISIPGHKLNGLWGSYYAVLWNSQHFGIRLAYLTLQQDFLPNAKRVLRRLLVKLKNSTGDFVVARHFRCMAAFLGFGIATMGAGVLLAWGTAGGSLIRHEYKEHTVDARIAVLSAAFPRLADIQGLSPFHTIHRGSPHCEAVAFRFKINWLSRKLTQINRSRYLGTIERLRS